MTRDRVVRIGTRGSELARIQARMAGEAVARAAPSVSVEYVLVETTADRRAETPLRELGGKGIFVKEIELALLRGEVDLAVHSMKDMPAAPEDGPDALVAVPALERASPRDVLVARESVDLSRAPKGFRIGTSGPRRRAQILHRWPHVVAADIRGNVPTRIVRLARGEYDAIVLAEAGIERLGASVPWMRRFEPEEMLPAAHQGTLALQFDGRAIPDWLREAVRTLTTDDARTVFMAERSFVRAMDGDCHSPIAAYACRAGSGKLRLRARVLSPDGTKCLDEEGECAFDGDSAAELGRRLAARMKERGASNILREDGARDD